MDIDIGLPKAEFEQIWQDNLLRQAVRLCDGQWQRTVVLDTGCYAVEPKELITNEEYCAI